MDNPTSRRCALRLLCWTLALGAMLTAYHCLLIWLMRDTGLVLGVVGPGTKVYRLVPWYCTVDLPRRFNPGLIVTIVAFWALWRWFRLVAWDPGKLRRWFVPAAMGWYVALACLVAMIDGGPSRLARPYENLHGTDYIGGVDRVESAGRFLTDYTKLQADLPMHCRTHPPGGILLLWAVDHFVHPGETAAALATILAAALAVPAVHGLAREAGSQCTARLATVLFIIAPNVLLFTATSMEAVFMVPMVWTFYLLFRARRNRPWLLGAAGGLTASVAAMMTFSAAWLAVWAVVLVVVTTLVDRHRLRDTLLALTSAALAAGLFYLLLYLSLGYDLFAVLSTAVGQHAQIMEGGNQATLRQYLHLTLANPVAFFAGSGLVLAVLWAARTWKDFRDAGCLGHSETVAQNPELPGPCSTRSQASNFDGPAGALLNLSFLGSMVVMVLAPLYTLEVERIWIFLVPLVAIAAARELTTTDTAKSEIVEGPGHAVRMAFVLLAGQTVLMEALLDTLW